MAKRRPKKVDPTAEELISANPVLTWLFDASAKDHLPSEFEGDLSDPAPHVWDAVKYAAGNWPFLAPTVSKAIHDKALWRIIGYPLFVGDYIESSRVPLDDRLAMLGSLETISLAIPELHGSEPMETGYFMQWDCVASALKDRDVQDACLAILEGLVANSDERVQSAALHGLGHLNHPSRGAVVQRFIDGHRRSASLEELAWLEACRDGTVM